MTSLICVSCVYICRLLRNKHLSDENFVTICRLRQGAAKYSLGSLLQLPVSVPNVYNYNINYCAINKKKNSFRATVFVETHKHVLKLACVDEIEVCEQ